MMSTPLLFEEQQDVNSVECFWASLAFVRFGLATIVLIGHIHDFFLVKDWTRFFSLFSPQVAVFSFLLISGYSIAHSIAMKPNGFLIRRARRIFSVYWPVLMLNFILMWTINEKFEMPNGFNVLPPTLWEGIGHLFLLQEFFVTTISSNLPLWSLSIECWYYVVAPLLILIPFRWMIGMILVSAAAYCCRQFYIFQGPSMFGYPMFILGWGWLLGFVYYYNKEKILIKALMFTLPLFVAVPILLRGKYPLASINIISTVFCISYARNFKLPLILRQIFNYLGDISFPLYVLHWPAILFSYAILKIQNPIFLTLFSFLLAVLLLPVAKHLSNIRICHSQNGKVGIKS